MQSPLPSSSALESGLVADPPSPYRMTGIQDSVRSILRRSVLGRIGQDSHRTNDEEETIQIFNDVWEDPRSPSEECNPVDRSPSPTETRSVNTSKPASFVTANGDNAPVDPPPVRDLSTRMSLLSHPDLETNLAALGLLNQQEARHHSRCNHNRRRRQNRHKHVKPQDTELRIFYVAISGLLLAALLATCETLSAFTIWSTGTDMRQTSQSYSINTMWGRLFTSSSSSVSWYLLFSSVMLLFD